MYGLVLLLLALNFRLIRLEDVKEVGVFLTGIFPLLFVPAAAGVMDERFEEFGELFGRKYGRIMCDHVEGADTVVLCMGSMSGTVKHVVKEMRAAGRKVGICRVVAFRPFPTVSYTHLRAHET